MEGEQGLTHFQLRKNRFIIGLRTSYALVLSVLLYYPALSSPSVGLNTLFWLLSSAYYDVQYIVVR